jgi:hypothetical protein
VRAAAASVVLDNNGKGNGEFGIRKARSIETGSIEQVGLNGSVRDVRAGELRSRLGVPDAQVTVGAHGYVVGSRGPAGRRRKRAILAS